VTVTLRPLEPHDDAWLDTWLGEVATATAYAPAAVDAERPAASLRQYLAHGDISGAVIERDGHVGIIVTRRMPEPDAAAIIEFVATPPHAARSGSGMAAAAAIEDVLRSQGARMLYAPAPAVHGIAMYFWIRLGYRPLLRPEWPCDLPGVAWLRREIS
jgi:GNAT superfamily N-acetyltransferase